MEDLREDILVRLVEVCEALDVGGVYRNDLDLSDEALPALVIMDGDENADDNDPEGRTTLAPRRVSMTPEVYILLRKTVPAPQVGTALNTIRRQLIHAVLDDSELKALTINNRSICYGGGASGLSRGRSLLGEMGLQFAFTYILRPDRLVDEVTA